MFVIFSKALKSLTLLSHILRIFQLGVLFIKKIFKIIILTRRR